MIIDKNLHSEMNCYQIGVLVYSFNKFKSDNKQRDQQILHSLEQKVVQLVEECGIREIGQILWGYTNNIGIQKQTIDMIVQKVLEQD